MPLLRPPVAPRLPDPEGVYSQRFMGALLGVLRQFFSQIQTSVQPLLGLRGATYLETCYGSAQSASSQTAASTTVAYPITYTALYKASGVTLTSGSRLTVSATGVYFATTNLQFANNNAAVQRAYFWLRVNGVDVADSCSNVSVTGTHGGQPGHMAIESTIPLQLAAGDYVEVVWATQSTDLFLQAIAAGASPTRPAAPSAITTMHFISAVP